MDANEKDAAKLRRREEMLARRVGEALDRLDSSGAGECPDAELIAAYSERALAPEESAQWENHFAACARCRTVLQVLAASGETPLAESEIARLGELVSAASVDAEPKKGSPTPNRRRSADWRVRWLAPAIGVAAVLAVWFAMRPPWRAIQQREKPSLLAEATKTQPPVPPASLDQFARGEARSTQETRSGNSGNAPSAKAQQIVTNARPGASPPPALPPPKPQAEQTPALQSVTVPQAETAMQQPRPETTLGAAMDKDVQEKKSTTRQNQASEARTLSVPELAPRVAMNADRSASITAAKTPASAPITATSPFGSTIWRAGIGGRIEISADAGESWTPQISPAHEDWLAGAAVSDAVCWLAGRNGAIARTTDGEHWELVMPPAQAAATAGKMPDWIGITARGPLSATITARDGRRFATSDGGSSWQPQ